MSNAEAAKTGLYNCEPDSINRFMVCNGRLPGEYSEYPVKLHFDAKTKRLDRVIAQFSNWRSDDEKIAVMRAALKIEECPSDSLSPMNDWYAKEKCYVRPDQHRWISWNPGHETRRSVSARYIEVGVIRNSTVVKAYFAGKQSAIDRDRRSSEFAKGR